MTTPDFWINLPVKDIERSKHFFNAIGFNFRSLPDNPEDSACMIFGSRNVAVMLFEEKLFKSFSDFEIADTNKNVEVLFSIEAVDENEVNSLAEKVTAAGGTVFAAPAEKEGWMYGCGFADPDGHRWSVLYMDVNKVPKPKTELQVP
jgi:predicted lactoylglutathione lyase